MGFFLFDILTHHIPITPFNTTTINTQSKDNIHYDLPLLKI